LSAGFAENKVFIPLKDLNPRRSYPIINTTLILLNVLVFLYQYTLSPHAFKLFMTTNATIPARFPAWLSGHAPFEVAFLPLLTSMFLHSGIAHIAGNMLFLWIFGDNVEDFYGHFTYLLFYLVCGIGSGLLHVLFNLNSAVPAVGASGAISGVMGAYALLYPRSRILTLVFIFLVPIPAVIILGYWFVLQFLAGITSLGMTANGGVAVWAHVGGFLLGMLITSLARGGKTARWQSA
jgi:membrane associated rhomboid family serine protease